FDLRAGNDPKELEAWWSHRGSCRCFALHHVEARLHDAAWQEAILTCLEASVFDAGVSLVVTSAMEPFHYLLARIARPPDGKAADARGTELLPRWSLVLSGLTKERYDLPLSSTVRVPDDVRAALEAQVADEGAAGPETMEGRHRELWRTLTRDE